MACLAHVFDRTGSHVMCTNSEYTPGLGLCHLHSLEGTQPRLPPVVDAASGMTLRSVSFSSRGAHCAPAGRWRGRRAQSKGIGVTRLPTRDAVASCSLLPYCPAHTLLRCRLLVDVQRIGNGFGLGMYAFNALLGKAPVFVPGSEVVGIVLPLGVL